MEQHHGDNYETTPTGGDRIKLNVGGKLFETTATTLRSGGPDSLLSALSLRPDPNPVFIDRDPDIFSVLLSLLRSNRLPGSGFSTQELIEEAAYYGIEGLVKSATSPVEFSGIDASRTAMIRPASEDLNPVFIDRDPDIFFVLLSLLRSNRLRGLGFSTQELTEEAAYYGTESLVRSATSLMEFSGIDAGVIATIRTASEGIVSSLSALLDGSLLVAHGGQVSSYDWSLSHVSTIRTHLEDIAAIRGVMPQIAAIGSYYNQGLHFYSLNSGRRVGSVDWSDPTDPRIYKARVGSITDSDDSVFASFDCPHRENAILQIDKQTLKSISEIGRQKGSSTKTGVASKLAYLPDPGIIFGCSVTSSAFGYSGYVRLWDPRSGGVVWETNEPGSGRSSRFGDSFADVDVDVEGAAMFKVCSKSGDLGVADLRKLGEDPWVYLVDKNPSMRYVEGVGSSVLCCYKKQVFVGREGGLEVWSRVEEREEVEERESLFHEEAFRRNFVDKVEDSKRGLITKIEGGGDRLFVCREDVEGVEVWESSGFSGVVSV